MKGKKEEKGDNEDNECFPNKNYITEREKKAIVCRKKERERSMFRLQTKIIINNNN